MRKRLMEEPEKEKMKELIAKYAKKEAELGADSIDKRFSCTKCEFASIHKISFTKHILSIHEEIRYQCEQCDKNYSDSSALRRHKKSVHEGFIHRCDICDEQFSQQSATYRHKKTMHPLENKSSLL